jgi:hypothetical protein
MTGTVKIDAKAREEARPDETKADWDGDKAAAQQSRCHAVAL